MDLGLAGKVAIITGGSEGIGKASAISMIREGASVVICARTQETLDSAAEEITTYGPGEVYPITGDVTDPEHIERIVAETINKLGRLDILVNNAGTAAASNFETVDDEVWQRDMDLKLFAAIRFSRLSIPHMKKVGGGRIINITIIEGKQPPSDSVPTSVTRAAGIAFTKALSNDVAKYDILVNTVCIGLVKSRQHERQFLQIQAKDPDVTLDNFYKEMSLEVPLKRVGESYEAGDVICFLASSRASYLTGTSINIDGGMSGVV